MILCMSIPMVVNGVRSRFFEDKSLLDEHSQVEEQVEAENQDLDFSDID